MKKVQLRDRQIVLVKTRTSSSVAPSKILPLSGMSATDLSIVQISVLCSALALFPVGEKEAACSPHSFPLLWLGAAAQLSPASNRKSCCLQTSRCEARLQGSRFEKKSCKIALANQLAPGGSKRKSSHVVVWQGLPARDGPAATSTVPLALSSHPIPARAGDWTVARPSLATPGST
jgi:hypothetical protein